MKLLAMTKMRTIGCWFAILPLACTAPPKRDFAPPPLPAQPTVLIIGDSISMEKSGYFEGLVQRLGPRYRVVHNPANGGDSANVLAHIQEWVTAAKPDIIQFNSGLHDIRTGSGGTRQNRPPDVYERNLREIVSYLKTNTHARLIYALTTPVNDVWHHRARGFDRHEADVQLYNQIAGRIMKENDIAINDLHEKIVSAGADSCFINDGVHMNDRGKAICAEAVAAAIERIARSNR